MSNIKNEIEKYINKLNDKNNNDNTITKSTIKTYVSNIYKIYKLNNLDNEEFEPEDFLYEYKKIIQSIDDMKNITTKKTYIASILYILRPYEDKRKKIYSDYLFKLKDIINEEKLNQNKNDKEIKNWIKPEELKTIYNNLKNNYELLLSDKTIKNSDYQKLQDYIIISLYFLQKPRRLKDYTELKYNNIDIKKDNYIDFKNKQFIFNDFKTKKKFINNKVDIENSLLNKLLLFIKLKKNNKYLNNEYILESNNNQKLSSVNLNYRLNNLLGDNISVNMLRKSYLTDIYKDIPNLKDILKVQNDMANSFAEQLNTYVKK